MRLSCRVTTTAHSALRENGMELGSSQDGPFWGDELSATTFIQRVNTDRRSAPATTCTASNVGTKAFVPYTADYIFYKDAEDR